MYNKIRAFTVEIEFPEVHTICGALICETTGTSHIG